MSNPTPADGTGIDLYRGKSSRRRGADRVIADLAARQHGVVALFQLAALDLDAQIVDRRVAAGRLHHVHQGVYAVGHPRLSRNGRFMAGVLAGGRGAVLSHSSAAVLWGLREDPGGPVDITAPNRRGRWPSGISAHRDGVLQACDCTTRDGIPCTTVAKTLLDFAGSASMWELRKAVAEAEVLRLLHFAEIRRLIKRNRGRRGVARLRLILDELDPDTRRTRSDLERLFLRMCSRNELPRPEVNVPLEVDGRRLEPDFLWRDAGLIVEADGRRYNDTASAFQHDRRREQRLQLAGWRVSRCTWEQVENEPRR